MELGYITSLFTDAATRPTALAANRVRSRPLKFSQKFPIFCMKIIFPQPIIIQSSADCVGPFVPCHKFADEQFYIRQNGKRLCNRILFYWGSGFVFWRLWFLGYWSVFGRGNGVAFSVPSGAFCRGG